MTEDQDYIAYECRTQYNDTGSTEMPEEYKKSFHKRAAWRHEELVIIREEMRSSMHG